MLTMNLWVNIPSFFTNCLAFACSRNSYEARAGFAILYALIYLVVFVLVLMWIIIDPKGLANSSEEFKSACSLAFTLRLIYFVLMTLVLISLLASHMMVRKARAQEAKKCENLKKVIPTMAKSYALPHSDGREFIIPATLSEFESLEKEARKLPHCCGLCLYRFREEAWKNRPDIEQIEAADEEGEETESDGADEANVWQGEQQENQNTFDGISRSSVVQLSCGRYHIFHQKCLLQWVDG